MHILNSSNFPPLCALMNLIALFGGSIIFILLLYKLKIKFDILKIISVSLFLGGVGLFFYAYILGIPTSYGI